VGSLSLPEIVTSHAERRPHGLAYTFLESGERDSSQLTWASLDRRIGNLATAMRREVPRGARVLLLFPPGLDFVPAFFASIAAGVIAVPSYPPGGHRSDRLVSRLRGMIADAGISLVVAPSAIHARRAMAESVIPELRDIEWFNVDEVDDVSGARLRFDGSPTDVVLLQYTSGSTSDPRGVMVTHGNLLHNLEASAALAGHDHRSIGVSWLPVNHDMGLIDGVLQPAYSGFPVTLMAPGSFLQRPSRWLRAISRLRATHSGAPNFAYDLCVRRIDEAERASLDLSTWDIAYNGAEPVRATTLEAFHRAFGPYGFRWESFRPAYGLAEATLLAASAPPGEEPATLRADATLLARGRVARGSDAAHAVSLIGCGRPAPGMRIEIVDPVQRTRSATGEIGEIWIAGPSVAAGYWNRPAESSSTFEARLADANDERFLRTGDLGIIRHQQLYVTGRLKDVLIVRGLKHYPQDVELTAERAHPALRGGGCAAVSDVTPPGASSEPVVIHAEIASGYGWQTQDQVDGCEATAICLAIARALNDAHGFAPAEIVRVPAGTLPRTTSGKLQRFQCRSEFAGDASVLYRWRPKADHAFLAERVAS
jgi:acyl-CoA synthetase (AMP-forming)/AMP-acid ligase II